MEQLLEKLKLMLIELRQREGSGTPQGSQILKENKNIASEKHTEKSAKVEVCHA